MVDEEDIVDINDIEDSLQTSDLAVKIYIVHVIIHVTNIAIVMTNVSEEEIALPVTSDVS